IDILPGHMALYEANDARRALFFEGNGALRTGKYNTQFGTVPIIRLAEMYLIRAESNQRLNSTTGATPLEDVNRLRTRSGLAAKTSVTLDDILLERRLELAFEGHRIHDIRRLKQRFGNFDYNDPKLVFPIPAREIEANKNLVQNAGY
ncbi:MAG TPA: RagB/SusD family nutrient uptake outer membrane protein, partial [Saprospiraceae bacterium]|nr:RagB/SusD family nutrient uptake outer membrane protein [Saprospiraceae bacterium]